MPEGLEDQNVWCEHCKIPMLFSYLDDDGHAVYGCHGCTNAKTVYYNDQGRIVVMDRLKG